MNLTSTYSGRPMRQVRTFRLPVRKGNAANRNARSWGIDDARAAQLLESKAVASSG